MFWGGVAENAEGGYVADKTDSQLESWAKWEGEPGLFAAFVKEHCLSDGRVKHWEATNGPLDERRRKDRERKAAQRSRGQSADIPQDVRRNSSATGRNETSTTTTTTNARAREEQPDQIVQHEAEPERESGIGNRESEQLEGPSRPPPGSADARLIAKFDFDAAQLVGDFLDEIADHPKRAAVVGYLTMWASGHSMPPTEKATPEEIATGLAAYHGEVPAEKRDYSERHVWAFIRSIVRRRTNPAPARASPHINGTGTARASPRGPRDRPRPSASSRIPPIQPAQPPDEPP